MGKVLRADASLDAAFVQFDLPLAQPEVWATAAFGFRASGLAALQASAVSGSFLGLNDSPIGGEQDGLYFSNGTFTPEGWRTLWGTDGGGSLATGTYHLGELRYVNGSPDELFIDGVSLGSGSPASPQDIASVLAGWLGTTGIPDSVMFFDYVAYGTTRGGDDLFSDDFEDGTLDAWSLTYGDVSVVDDPFPAPVGRELIDQNWRIIVTSIGTQTLSILDKRVSGGTFLFPLDAPAYHSGQVPADDPEINIPWPDPTSQANVSNNTRLIYAFRREAGSPPYECRFGGIIMSIEDQGTDIPVSRYTAYDPWQYMFNRPVRNPYTGALPDPATGLTFPMGSLASDIALLLLEATETVDGNTFVDLTDLSLVENTDPLPAPITFDAGLSVGEAWNQLVATGTIDIALPPIYDPGGRPGKVCMFQCASMLGSVRYGAVMSWDRSIRTVMNLSRLIDGTRLANQVQWFGANGQPVALQSAAGSIAANGEYWAQQFFPDATNATILQLGALAELLIRRYGERTVSLDVAPEAPEVALRDYVPGDWLPVWASRNLREPIAVDYGAFLSDPTQPGAAGYMRIQAIPISLDDNGVETVPGLMLSRDGAGSGA